MRIIWSLPVRGERLSSSRGDLVRARRLIEALQAQGHELEVVADADTLRSRLSVSSYRRLVRRVPPARLALVLRDVGRWLHARGLAQRVASRAREQGAELLIETQVGFAGSGALAARLTGLPLILDDCSPSLEEEVLGAGLPGLARQVLARQACAATAVVAVTPEVKERLVAEGLPAHKLRVVPNGVALSEHEGLDGLAVRRRLGLDGALVIGYAGSFQPWHRVERLVSAFARLPRDLPSSLLLVGEGITRATIEAMVLSWGLAERVRFPGAVPLEELPSLLAAFDVAVLPATNPYGHPMKLLEYAAAALPIVAPDVSTVRPIVSHEETGLLFPDADEPALSETLARLLGDATLRERLGRRARASVGPEASWESRAAQLLEGVPVCQPVARPPSRAPQREPGLSRAEVEP